jgi:proton glutamate symport protein
MEMVFMIVRWAVLLALCYFGYKKKNLTTWIIISMAVGAEIGYSFPDVAKELKILSDIFLRLIKTISRRHCWTLGHEASRTYGGKGIDLL